MNFNDEFYSRIKESPNNKTEVNKTINAVFVYLVSEACVEFIVYRTKVFKVDNINEKTHMLLMNEDCVYLNVKIYKDGTGICWKDSLASGIVVTKEIAKKLEISDLLAFCYEISDREFSGNISSEAALLESATLSAKEKVFQEWENKPFPGPELTAAGFVMPTPREYAKHLQTYYKEKIDALEKKVSELQAVIGVNKTINNANEVCGINILG